jgi:hypothetical protein
LGAVFFIRRRDRPILLVVVVVPLLLLFGVLLPSQVVSAKCVAHRRRRRLLLRRAAAAAAAAAADGPLDVRECGLPRHRLRRVLRPSWNYLDGCGVLEVAAGSAPEIDELFLEKTGPQTDKDEQ